MKKSPIATLSMVLIIAGFFMGNSAIANPQHQMYGPYGPQHMQSVYPGYPGHKGRHHGQGKQHGSYDHRRGNLLGPHWKETLTDQQRVHIDQLHLAFAKARMTLKSKMKTLKVELALLATAEEPDTETIEKKIDELLELKKNLMRIRYAHIVDMRKVLTIYQRTSFDLDVLQKAKQGRRHRH